MVAVQVSGSVSGDSRVCRSRFQNRVEALLPGGQDRMMGSVNSMDWKTMTVLGLCGTLLLSSAVIATAQSKRTPSPAPLSTKASPRATKPRNGFVNGRTGVAGRDSVIPVGLDPQPEAARQAGSTPDREQGTRPQRVAGRNRTSVPEKAPAEATDWRTGLKVLRDLSYVENGHARQKLDLYLPFAGENRTGPPARAVVIWIHGGGWEGGDKADCPVLPFLRDSRLAIASINYRFSQESPFPAQLEDCRTAIRYLREFSREYGLDTTRFAVAGRSAGGHLAALVGATGQVQKCDTRDWPSQSSAVHAVIDFCGPTNLALYGQSKADDTLGKLIGGPIQNHPDRVASANPITHLAAATHPLPPYLIVHGEDDPIVPLAHSRELEATLQKLRVPVELHTVPKAGHNPVNAETLRQSYDFVRKWVIEIQRKAETGKVAP